MTGAPYNARSFCIRAADAAASLLSEVEELLLLRNDDADAAASLLSEEEELLLLRNDDDGTKWCFDRSWRIIRQTLPFKFLTTNDMI